MINYWIVATFLLGLAAAVMAFVNFDIVIKTLHDKLPGEWEKAGKPMGFFWLPKELKFAVMAKMKASRARGKCVFRWMFKNPAWVEKESAAAGALGKFRLFVLVMFVFFAATIVQMIALMTRPVG